MERDRTDPPLTAADLDRLAHEWSERRVVTNSVEHREKADWARQERMKAALPSLVALARRGLEADAPRRADEPLIGALFWGVEAEEVRRAVEQSKERLAHVESAESKLAAALAEVERVWGRLDESEAEAQRWRDRANKMDAMLGGCTYVEDAERDIAIYRSNRSQAWSGSHGKRNVIVGTLTWGAAWFAAEQAQAGQAAKQGGEGRA